MSPLPRLRRRRRAPLEDALRVLRHVKPWAAPRLPDEWLTCFDAQQRLIRPHPTRDRAHLATIPGPRAPHRGEVTTHGRRR